MLKNDQYIVQFGFLNEKCHISANCIIGSLNNCISILRNNTQTAILCVKTTHISATLVTLLSDFEPGDFWGWSTFSDYVQCVISMIGVTALLTFAFVDSPTYIESIGTLSLCTEATLALPQLFKNFSSGSTQGMR